jgi:anthranilate synthase component 1
MRRRVIATHLGGWVDPAEAFRALCTDSDGAFWLDSGIGAATGWSMLGTAARRVTASVEEGTVTESPSGRRHLGSIFEFLRGDLAEPDHEILTGNAPSPSAPEAHPDAGPFGLGWVGWLGYELHAQTMGTGLGRRSRHPDAALLFVDRAVVFDHAAGVVSLLALGARWEGDLAAWRQETVDRLFGKAGPAPRSPAEAPEAGRDRAPGAAAGVDWASTDEEYLELLAACRRSIADGDAYQLCLTNEARLPVHPDPIETYLALRRASPTHHGGFLRIGEVSLLSASPERFLTVTADGIVETRPIKGTRPRGRTDAEDAALAAELLASEKERAENLMIVDLMRNDLGRVCEVGTVSVPTLFAVESYAQVHQLVSTVRGRLAAGASGVDAVEACFPAGSMTGAPKHSAISILDGLERRPRGIYSGAFGYFGLDGRVELAMVIRSMVIDPDGVSVGAGGGVTALSVPEEELEEVRVKARALLGVLGAAMFGTAVLGAAVDDSPRP